MACPGVPDYDDPNRRTSLTEWDAPCLNCGRFGTIPGQMITDLNNNTFCSPDCGWSHLLRPMEQHRAAKLAAAAAAAAASGVHTGAAPRTRRPSRTSSRSSRHHEQLMHQQRQQQQHRVRHLRKSQVGSPTDVKETQVSSRRPPKNPQRKLEAWEIARSRCMESGNAMFDFMMMMMGDDKE